MSSKKKQKSSKAKSKSSESFRDDTDSNHLESEPLSDSGEFILKTCYESCNGGCEEKPLVMYFGVLRVIQRL